MAVQLPNGAIIEIASGYTTTPEVVTGITNASPAIVSASAHGFLAGDYIEETSGWSALTARIVRVGAPVTTDSFALEAFDTTNLARYSAGNGGGTVRKITGWTQLQQVTAAAKEGGEQQFLTYQFLEADAQQRIPTFKNAAGLNITIADDPSLPGYQLAAAANDDRQARAVRVRLSTGGVLLLNAFISLSRIPSLTVNTLMDINVTFSFLGDPVRYAS